MHTITRIQSSLKRHPIIALACLVMLAVLSPVLGAAALVVALAALAGPSLLARHRPELAIELVEEQARGKALKTIQATSAMGADRLEMVRAAERQAFYARQWDERAQRAVLAGRDVEATACLDRRRQHLEAHAGILAELEQQTKAVAEMQTVVDGYHVAARAERPANVLFLGARARRAGARKEAALDRLGLSRDPVVDVVRQVQRAEDEAEALDQVVGSGADPLAAKYAKEEAEARARQELDELKQRVGMKRPALPARVG